MIDAIISNGKVFEVRPGGTSPCDSCALSPVCMYEEICNMLLGEHANFQYSPELTDCLADDPDEIVDGDSRVKTGDVVAGWFVRKLVKEYKKHNAAKTEMLRKLQAQLDNAQKQLLLLKKKHES